MNDRLLKRPRLELTPLTDLAFLLLTFFIFAVLQMKMVSGLKVDLPSIGGGGDENKNYVSVTITADNQIYLGREPVNLERLSQELFRRKKMAGNKDILVAINGDEKASHGVTVRVLAALQRADIKQVFFEVSGKRKTINSTQYNGGE